jgi:AP-2 complex subunit alpha
MNFNLGGNSSTQSQGIRGLSIFIGDIRGCQTKD